MAQSDALAADFESHRPRLQAMAHRMLGSADEAADAMQEAWLRLDRHDAEVENLGGWLTTVVGRLCLDALRTRAARRETPLDGPTAAGRADHDADPERAAVLAAAVGPALLAVLDTLPPPERVAFVLHDLFAVPFSEIAPLVERSPEATRQLASRGRRRVRGAVPQRAVDADRQRVVVEAFFAAAHRADFGGLLALLHPNARLRADAVAADLGAPAEVRGGAAVAEFFSGKARAARIAVVGGTAGAVWAPGGVPKVVFRFTLRGATIRAIDLVAEPAAVAALDVTVRPGTKPPAR